MRSLSFGLAFSCLALAAGAARAQQAPPAPAAPACTYALVSAVGDRLAVATERRSTGSHLDNYRRSRVEAPGDLLNRLVLHGLDRELAASHPECRRVLLAMHPPGMDGVPPGERDAAALRHVTEELAKLPARDGWTRIVVATPAYKAFEHGAIASRLQGLGVSMHPLQPGRAGMQGLPFDAAPGEGEAVVTPDGSTARSAIYLAPYAYLTVRVLDGRTLAVLDAAERYDNVKLGDPRNGSFDLVDPALTAPAARRFVGLVERAVHEALARTGLGGRVDVHEVREVKPEKR